ncbi:MAG TPA: autotransporter-associated beta strand repeat-containing protein, partial [Pirellulales bacterium]
SESSYTGSTLVVGNVLSLVDQGQITSTSVTVVNSALQWNDTGIQALANRLPSNANLTLNGGGFQFISRSGTDDSISINNLSLTGGASVIREDVGVSAAATGVGTAAIEIGGTFTRATGSTLTFYAGTGGIGDNPSVTFNTAPTLSGGTIGGWAVVYGAEDPVTGGANVEFATYGPSVGVRPLDASMQYVSFLAGNADPTANIRLGGNAAVTSGGQTINSLTINGAAATVSFLSATDTLTITSGGILSGTDANNRTIGTPALPGIITTTGPELFINQGNSILTINSQITGTASLVMSGMGFANGQAVLVNNNNNTYSGATYVSGVIAELDDETGSGHTLGTNTEVYLNGSNNSATDSLAVADSVIRLFASSQINPLATVNVLGEAQFDLNGFNQSLASLAMQSLGGSNGGNGATVTTGAGVLTLTNTTGTLGVSNVQDLRTVASVFGNLALPSTAEITLAYNADGNVGNNSFTNYQAGLAINANITSGGTVNVDGTGALSLGGASTAQLSLSVASGTEILLGAYSNYQNTTIALSSGAALDMRGVATELEVGSVSGAAGSTIKNFSATAAGTLVTGSDNTSTTFSGTITSDYTSGLLSVTKIGSGQWTLGGNNASQPLGTLTVGGGSVLLGGSDASNNAGTLGFTNYTLNAGGTLTLDNSVNAVSGRLGINGSNGLTAGSTAAGYAFDGQARGLTMQGGTLAITGGSTAITETLGAVLTLGSGGSEIVLTPGTGGVNLNVLLPTVTNVTAQTGSDSLLILGAASSVGAGNGTIGIAGILTVPGTQGSGADGSVTMSIRPDIIGDPSSTGTGSGFVVLDPTSKVLRPLNQTTELAGGTAGNSAAITGTTTNVGIGAATTAAETVLTTNVTANSLTLLSGGTGFTNVFGATGGNYDASGLMTVTLNSGGLLALGGTLGSNVALTSATVTMDLNVTAGNTLTLNNSIINTTNGVVVAQGGTLIFNTPEYYTGATGSNGTVINGGTLQLGASLGNNPILVNPTASTPTVLDLQMNGVGSTFDLNGNSQAVGRLSSVNPLAGQAGNIITSTGSATLTVVEAGTGTSTYSGSIGGAPGTQVISLVKQGANTLELSGANSYTGTTNVMGGTLLLRDSGSIAGTTGINLNYAALTYDNTGLATSTSRLPATNPTINFAGGTFNYYASQGTNNLTLGAISASGSANTVTSTLWASTSNYGSSVVLTSSSLTQTGQGTFNVTVTGGALGAPVSAVAGTNPTNSGSNTQLVFTTAPAVNNGIIGGWAIANSTDYAGYLAPTSAISVATGFAGYGALGTSMLLPGSAQTTSGSIIVGVPGTSGLAVGELVSGTGIPANDVIASINATNDTITLAAAATATGSIGLSVLPFGNYSADLLSAGVASDNISVAAAVGGVTERTVNSVKLGAFAATLNTQGDTLTLGSGGLLASGAGTVAGGQLTAGAAVNLPTTLYAYTNAATIINSPIVDNGLLGSVTLEKSGASTLTLNTLPTAWTTSTTTSSNTVTLPGAAYYGGATGLVVGQSVNAAALGQPAGAIITSIVSATQYTLSANVTTGSATAAGTQLNFPTTQVLSGETLTSGSNSITVPAGFSVLPGDVVTIGTPGSAATLAASTTVLSVSGTTVTLSNNFGGTTASGVLLFAPEAAQTIGVTNTSNTNTLSLGTAAGLNVGQTVTGTGIPTSTYITGLSGTTVTLSANTTSAVTSAVFAALAPNSQITGTTSGSATIVVPSTLGIVVGEPVIGAGIAQGTTVASITDTYHLTLSQAATATGTLNAYFGEAPVGVNIAGVSIPASSSTLALTNAAGLVAG